MSTCKSMNPVRYVGLELDSSESSYIVIIWREGPGGLTPKRTSCRSAKDAIDIFMMEQSAMIEAGLNYSRRVICYGQSGKPILIATART